MQYIDSTDNEYVTIADLTTLVESKLMNSEEEALQKKKKKKKAYSVLYMKIQLKDYFSESI